MEDEVEVIEQPVKLGDDINSDLEDAIKELEGQERTEDGKFTAKVTANEEAAPIDEVAPAADAPKAPQSWTAEAKAEWDKTPERIRSEILKRENDMHQALTRHDGDLRLGREMKDVVTPYMPIIQAEGGTPQTAVRDLLNTAYVLRTGTPEQKKALLLTTAKQFGVDLGVSDDAEYVDPSIAALQQEIAQLRQLADPQAMESRLRESLVGDKIQSDIAAFASDPAHIHFEKVREDMAHFVRSGRASDLKEAYNMACRADPAISSTLDSARLAEQTAKRQQEMAQKKRAASSITGSPAIPGNSKMSNPKSSPQDDLRAAWDELESKI